MSGTEVSALERGREAYEDRTWALAFDELASADTADSLAAEDLERLGEAARWSRHFDQMLDTFERAAAAYAGGIIASATALDNVTHPFAVTEERSLTLKGLAAPVAVATVDWSEG